MATLKPVWTSPTDVIVLTQLNEDSSVEGAIDLSAYDMIKFQLTLQDGGVFYVKAQMFGSNDGGTTVDEEPFFSYRTAIDGVKRRFTLPIFNRNWIKIIVSNESGSSQSGDIEVTEKRRRWEIT